VQRIRIRTIVPLVSSFKIRRVDCRVDARDGVESERRVPVRRTLVEEIHPCPRVSGKNGVGADFFQELLAKVVSRCIISRARGSRT